MKLVSSLKINGTEQKLVSDYCRLQLSRPGSATFVIETDEAITEQSIVLYSLGYSDDDDIFPATIGFVHLCQEVEPGIYKVICKELSALLEIEAKFYLRHVTAKKLFQEIEKVSTLSFITTDLIRDYLQKKIPYFASIGRALDAVNQFAAFGVPRGIWTQLPDGKIYWGSWDDSPFAKEEPIMLHPSWITSRKPEDRSFVIPTIPALRPGSKIQNDSMIIDSLEIMGAKTVVRWLKINA